MSRTDMDPADFAARLDASFGAEPGHADLAQDLARGRRRLWRHRAGTATAGLALAVAVTGVVTGVPGLLPHQAAPLQAASAPLTDADVVQDCVSYNDHAASGGTYPDSISRAEVERLMGHPELMTRAGDERSTVATVRSEDAKTWLECTLRSEPGEPLKAFSLLYSTDVTFARKTVDGVRAYEPHTENDPRTWGTGSGDWGINPTCRIREPEETKAYDTAAAACPTYRVTWNGRRPPDVAKVLVRSPDGKELQADVREGYLSLDATLPMSPVVAAAFARGRQPDVQRIVFLARNGTVLADQPDNAMPSENHLTIYNWPSLAWWTKG